MSNDQPFPHDFRVTITSPKLYGSYRIHSLTRPDLGVGMLMGFAGAGHPGFTREWLEALDAETLRFYIDSYMMQQRGDERNTEEFVLQGAPGLDRDNWETIKPIVPLDGEDPNEFDDDDDGEQFSTEGYLAWENEQERLAEEAEERHRYPEESDDDDQGCPHCGSYTCNTWDCNQ